MRVYIVGDIHNNWSFIYNFFADKKDCYVIQVGDFNIGLNKTNHAAEQELIWLNKYLFERNIKMYIIRGNHDNPAFFKGNHIYSNLELLPDYSIREINKEKILFIGGAISINRSQATYGIDWFDDEKFVLDEKRLKEINGVTMLITHNTPDFCEPLHFSRVVYQYLPMDNGLLEELKYERKLHTKAWNILKEKNKIMFYFNGHMHESHELHIGKALIKTLNVAEVAVLEV